MSTEDGHVDRPAVEGAFRLPTAVRWVVGANVALAVAISIAAIVVLSGALRAAEPPPPARQPSDLVLMWGFIAAAASTGFGALGAAYAVSHVGAAALGAIGERPEIAGRALIFVGLAEGVAIYGLIISIMILARLG